MKNPKMSKLINKSTKLSKADHDLLVKETNDKLKVNGQSATLQEVTQAVAEFAKLLITKIK